AWRLTAGGNETVAFIQARLTAVPRELGPHAEKLLADLAAGDKSIRQAATERLSELGALATAALRAARDRQPAGEMRDRIDYLLEQADRAIPAGARLRAIRAVEVLEWTGTPTARLVLTELAAGVPEATLTQDATEALGRLAKPAER
ncbi:MAG TPA: hypothetical protein VH120_00310, partial [Gemmataceae bacterium]|nr:hypothetical protein [Gemmataceae bacterium]